LHDDLDDGADADPDQQRGEFRVEGRRTDEGAQDRRGAGDQPERRQSAERRAPVPAQWRDDGQALGRVVQGEAEYQEGAERELADGVG